MKIVTWNVNGVRARAGEVLEWIGREQPDVVCLQEIKASKSAVPETLSALPGYWSYWHGHKGYSGVGLLLRKATFPGRPAFEHPEFDVETRIVTARLGELIFASIYVPNGGKDFPAKMKFLEALERFSAAAQGEGAKLILCGDFNVAREERDVHPALRRPDMIGTTPKERELLEKIISHGLTDLLRDFFPMDDRLFTWWAPWRNMRDKNMGWRLDYVLAHQSLPSLSCRGYREFGTSDHGPVQAELEIAPPKYDPAPEPEPEPQSEPPPEPGQIPLL